MRQNLACDQQAWGQDGRALLGPCLSRHEPPLPLVSLPLPLSAPAASVSHAAAGSLPRPWLATLLLASPQGLCSHPAPCRHQGRGPCPEFHLCLAPLTPQSSSACPPAPHHPWPLPSAIPLSLQNPHLQNPASWTRTESVRKEDASRFSSHAYQKPRSSLNQQQILLRKVCSPGCIDRLPDTNCGFYSRFMLHPMPIGSNILKG